MRRRRNLYSAAEVDGILTFCTELDKLIRRIKARNPTADLRDYFVALNGLSAAMRAAVERDRLFTIYCGIQAEFEDYVSSDELYGKVE